MLRIRFQDEEYVFGGDSLDDDGFIAKEEDYLAFRESYAHYYHGYGIARHNECIGGREDIEVLGEYNHDA